MSARSANQFKRTRGDVKLPDFATLAKKAVAVGLPDDVIHDPSGLAYSELGTIHEFGSSDGRVPERSFLRSMLVDRRKDINRLLNTTAKRVANGRDANAELERLALWSQGAVQEQIVDVDTPANAPATIAKKKSDNPLVDTGAMRQAVLGLVIDDV